MMPLTVHVPTINDDMAAFDRLFRLWSQVNGDGLDVSFDFSRCQFIQQNGVAFLGALARLIEHRGGRCSFEWGTLQDRIRMNLAQQGFLAAFGCPLGPWVGNSIPFRTDLCPDKSRLMQYLKVLWLRNTCVQLSERLRDAIAGRVWELYENAFEHAQSPIGVFSCGQHYPNRGVLKLAIADFGVGIPSNVRIFSQKPNLPADHALHWAFQDGTTTKPDGMGRGVGLDLVKHFVRLNNGRLEMFSHDGYAIIEKTKEDYQTRAIFFEGTLLNISLNCDEKYYCLASEVSKQPLF